MLPVKDEENLLNQFTGNFEELAKPDKYIKKVLILS